MTAIDVQPAPSIRPWWMENAGCLGKSRLFFLLPVKGRLLGIVERLELVRSV